MANPGGRFGGIGQFIRKAVPYVATYVVGKKLGEREIRKEAKEETLEQREISDKEAQRVRDQLNKGSTGDYIRDKDI